jgi:tetratricopeptide (TPR) repeat protein
VRFTILDDGYQIVKTIFVDNSGRFTVKGLTMGRYIARVETTGTPYEEQSQQLELQTLRRIAGDETVTIEFKLRAKKGGETPAPKGLVFAQDVPKAARAEFSRGVKSLKNNQPQAAIASLKQAIAAFPDYFEALELLGIEYIKSGQYESALEVLTRANRINGRSARTLYATGVAHLNLHRPQEANTWLEQSAQLDSNNPNTHMMLGLAYGNGGALEKSEESFKKALQIGGAEAAEAHFYLAGLFNKQGKYREARRELELLLKESKSVKEPAQIKAMIEKLKEKELSPPPAPNSSAPASLSSSNQTPAAQDSPPQNLVHQSTGASPEPVAAAHAAAPAATTGEIKELVEPVEALSPENAELLSQCRVNGGTMHKQLFNYTYTLKKTRRVLNHRGAPLNTDEQVFEAYPIRGEHVLIRISVNGAPSPTLAEERRRAVKQLEEAERRQGEPAGAGGTPKPEDGYVSAGVFGNSDGQPGYVSIDVSAFLRSCEFFSPRLEKIDGRDTLVLNFRRRAGIALPLSQAYISKLVGTIWIDQADKILLRLEAWPASRSAFDLLQSTAPRDEAALIYQQRRLANGLWFPTMIRMNAGGRPELFAGLNWDVLFEFSNYQRFESNAGNVIIKPVN